MLNDTLFTPYTLKPVCLCECNDDKQNIWEDINYLDWGFCAKEKEMM